MVIYLTTKELAERWKVPAKSLVDSRSQGSGPAFYKIGGKVRYDLRDIEAFETRCSTKEQE